MTDRTDRRTQRIGAISALTCAAVLVASSCSLEKESSKSGNAVDHGPGPSDTTPKGGLSVHGSGAQRNAPPEYVAVREESGHVRFDNPARRFVTSLDESGPTFKSMAGTWSLGLRASGYYCQGAFEAGTQQSPTIDQNRVAYARPGLDEWYLNGPAGVEQGFTIHTPPTCMGHKAITMEIDGAAEAVLDDPDGDGRGESARFLVQGGAVALAYKDLFVRDAAGNLVPAWMTVQHGRLSIVVDDSEATYPLEIDPLVTTLETVLIEPIPSPSNHFGLAVAVDGNTAMVGSAQGLHAYLRSGGVWNVQQSLGGINGGFGRAVALDGNTVLIGAPYENGNGTNSGAAYVFTRSGATWTQQAKLVPGNLMTGDLFGSTVALDGDTAVIGMGYAEFIGNSCSQNGIGGAYVFVRNGSSWTLQQKLDLTDTTSFSPPCAADFGAKVSLSGNTALVSAPGEYGYAGGVYVFTRNGTTWSQQARLSGNGCTDQQGIETAIMGDVAVMTSYTNEPGHVCIYTRNAGVWSHEASLATPAGGFWDGFGSSVALDGNRLLVGARFVSSLGVNSREGAAYLFERNGGLWRQTDTLTAQFPAANDQFGTVVALSGATAMVGADRDDDGSNVDQGSVHVFSLQLSVVGQGQACGSNSDCGSGFCVDGVCCDSSCDMQGCMACTAAKKGRGLDGYCGAIAYDTDPDEECPAGACDGQFACKRYTGAECTGTAQCLSNYCVDGYCCNNICMGECYACSSAKKGSGYDGVCGVIAAGTNPDAECSNGGTCNGAGACSTAQTKYPNGSACVSAAQCNSGYCADGVCCDNWCTGTCKACTAAKKGQGADGTCGNIVAQSDPDAECGNGACSGQGTCKGPAGVLCSSDAECFSGFCVDHVCCTERCNGACSACSAAKKGQGVDGQCEPIAIGRDPDGECNPGECNGVGACNIQQAQLGAGEKCVTSAQCASGFCVDSVCCSTACDTTCVACSQAKKGSGLDGTCGPVAYDNDPDEECWGGSCSGTGVCKYYNGVACAMTTDCLSNYCVDGVCCGNTCTGTCMTCSAAKAGAGYDGVCQAIAAGTDPDNECAATCNGSGACGK